MSCAKFSEAVSGDEGTAAVQALDLRQRLERAVDAEQPLNAVGAQNEQRVAVACRARVDGDGVFGQAALDDPVATVVGDQKRKARRTLVVAARQRDDFTGTVGEGKGHDTGFGQERELQCVVGRCAGRKEGGRSRHARCIATDGRAETSYSRRVPHRKTLRPHTWPSVRRCNVFAAGVRRG